MYDVDKCPQCGCTQFVQRPKAMHMGLYCSECGRWIKWVKQSKSTSVTPKQYSDTVMCSMLEEDTPPWE